MTPQKQLGRPDEGLRIVFLFKGQLQMVNRQSKKIVAMGEKGRNPFELGDSTLALAFVLLTIPLFSQSFAFRRIAECLF